jgi:hypothetical protein
MFSQANQFPEVVGKTSTLKDHTFIETLVSNADFQCWDGIKPLFPVLKCSKAYMRELDTYILLGNADQERIDRDVGKALLTETVKKHGQLEQAINKYNAAKTTVELSQLYPEDDCDEIAILAIDIAPLFPTPDGLVDCIELDIANMKAEAEKRIDTLSDETMGLHEKENSWKNGLSAEADLNTVQIQAALHLTNLKGLKIHQSTEQLAQVMHLVTRNIHSYRYNYAHSHTYVDIDARTHDRPSVDLHTLVDRKNTQPFLRAL